MRFLKALGVGVILFIGISLSAQDIHFSQFYMSPLNLNPALTGVMNCNTRMVGNYRNQWASVLKNNAYNTYSVSYDQKIPVGRSDYFGIGGSFWGDVAGASRFGTMQGRLSLSYSKKMGGYRKKAHYLVVGTDAAFSQRRIQQDKLEWPSQHDGNGGFDPTKGSNELGITDAYYYPDFTAGLLWFSVLNEYTNFYFGGAFSHLNQANQSFYANEYEALFSKFTFHAGGQFEVAPRVSLLPNVVMFFQGPHREFNAGTSLRFAMGRSRLLAQSFQIGGYYRVGTQQEGNIHSDAVILSTRFNYQEFGIGFSYDVNISKLRAVSFGNGAFEFSLTYNICGPENRGVYCPKF